MPDRFQERIDRLAAERGLGGRRLPGPVEVERGRGARRLGAGRGRGGARRARGEGRLVVLQSRRRAHAATAGTVPDNARDAHHQRPDDRGGAGALALRLRRAARRPRADVLPEERQVQGVHRRGHRRARTLLSAADAGGAAPQRPLPPVLPDARSTATPATSTATRCAAARCASSPAAPTSRRATPAWRSTRRHARRRPHPPRRRRNRRGRPARSTASRWTSARRPSCCA